MAPARPMCDATRLHDVETEMASAICSFVYRRFRPGTCL